MAVKIESFSLTCRFFLSLGKTSGRAGRVASRNTTYFRPIDFEKFSIVADNKGTKLFREDEFIENCAPQIFVCECTLDHWIRDDGEKAHSLKQITLKLQNPSIEPIKYIEIHIAAIRTRKPPFGQFIQLFIRQNVVEPCNKHASAKKKFATAYIVTAGPA